MPSTVLAITSKIVTAKPKPGMFISARDFLKIDMANSIMVGDKAEDMMAADAAGVGTKLLVKTGKPLTEQGEALATAVLESIREVPEYVKQHLKGR